MWTNLTNKVLLYFSLKLRNVEPSNSRSIRYELFEAFLFRVESISSQMGHIYPNNASFGLAELLLLVLVKQTLQMRWSHLLMMHGILIERWVVFIWAVINLSSTILLLLLLLLLLLMLLILLVLLFDFDFLSSEYFKIN